jgi:hypothetical protein
MIVPVILAFWLACAAVAGWVAKANGRPVAEGLALGFFLGLLGLAIEAWLPYHAAAKGHRRERQQALEARQAKAAQPLHLGGSPLRRGESGRMLADLKRDLDG